jgi:hypothetical protein
MPPKVWNALGSIAVNQLLRQSIGGCFARLPKEEVVAYIDEPRDTLHSSSPGQTPDGGLGDSLDVVPEDLAVALGSSLSKTLSSLASPRHDCWLLGCWRTEELL